MQITYAKDANLVSITSTDDFETCVIKKRGWKEVENTKPNTGDK